MMQNVGADGDLKRLEHYMSSSSISKQPPPRPKIHFALLYNEEKKSNPEGKSNLK